jgi:hypothetical protein
VLRVIGSRANGGCGPKDQYFEERDDRNGMKKPVFLSFQIGVALDSAEISKPTEVGCASGLTLLSMRQLVLHCTFAVEQHSNLTNSRKPKSFRSVPMPSLTR